ncbi:unnamed protein product [Rotaria sp. Silwood1]|nr:unnamed protein product [Rotaria sp. Silwood1]CAF1678434.1 unnamed protein product [Rotaria sp. Silwood1]
MHFHPYCHVLERVTPHFTNPTRVFFRLHYAEAESLWLDATSPSEYGGSGACEKLAFFGDNILRYHVIEILRQRHPEASTHQLATMKEEYLTNTKLNNCSNWFHFSHWLVKRQSASPQPSRRRRRSFRHTGKKALFHLPGKVAATVIEALLAATDQFHKKQFTRQCVLGLMKLMENVTCTSEDEPVAVVGCGTAVYTDHNLTHITGLLTCDPNHPHGVSFMDPDDMIQAFKNSQHN